MENKVTQVGKHYLDCLSLMNPFLIFNHFHKIYRAETLFDQPSVLESRIKDFVSSPFNYIGGREGCEQMPQMQLNQSKCGENISKFMQEKLRVEEEFEKERLGNLSPDTTIDSGYSMEPLDLSFDDDGQSLQYEILGSNLTIFQVYLYFRDGK